MTEKRSSWLRSAYTPFLTASALLMHALAFADASIGIDPYGDGFGFDRPQEAAWGGWKRCDAGTFYAEWDKFVDASYGTATDWSGAPLAADGSNASCGTTSAFLAWTTSATAPAFAYSNGTYVYNFSNGGQGGKTAFRLEASGPLAQGHTRVVLQLETRSYPVAEEDVSLNGLRPTVSGLKFEKETTINGRAAKVYHQLIIWNLLKAPEALRIAFETKEHTVIQMVTIDAGPLASVESPQTATEPTRTVLSDLPAEAIDAEKTRLLHLQKPSMFPEIWAGSDLLFKQTTQKSGRVVRSLKGSIKALIDEETQGKEDTLWLDLYRKDPIADVRIASCSLKATRKRWTEVNLDNVLNRIGTAVYRLDLTSDQKEGEAERIQKSIGACDIDLGTEGIQPGVPSLIEGDYGRLRRP